MVKAMRLLKNTKKIFLKISLCFFLIFNVYAVDEDFYDLDNETPAVVVSDPLEPINRGLWEINLFLLENLGKPVIAGYNTITTQGVRNSVTNFFYNLAMPFTIANYILQFDFTNAGKATHSFLINSTFGVLGLFDVADNNVKKSHLYVTLGKYGVPAGPYVMVPILGPNNLRGVFSDVVEFIFDPFGYNVTRLGYNIIEKKQITYIGYGMSFTSGLEQVNWIMEGYYDMIGSSFDSYNFIKDAHKQYQDNLIAK
ncbi:MAG: hypothetical protein Ta2D_07450 [Rickettsiales bacterium]|nr:MAG: hypothetical protein Ta2D_07450 [Rickettsiales bacterium]